MYHENITIEIITKKELEDNLNLSLNDNFCSAKDIKDMEMELKNIEEILQQIREGCVAASIAYDKYGHDSKVAERIREKKYSLVASPPILDRKCGGLTGGDTPKICLSNNKNCKVKAHKKNKINLLQGDTVYIMMAGHLSYPTPLIRKEEIAEEVYFELKKAQGSLKEAAHLRKKPGSCPKEDYNEFIIEFIQAKKEGKNAKQNGLDKKKNGKEINKLQTPPKSIPAKRSTLPVPQNDRHQETRSTQGEMNAMSIRNDSTNNNTTLERSPTYAKPPRR
eukprot:88471-Ditylum_brightwellii.AAC.1